MASLGTLAVNVVARTAPFTKGITAATASLGKFTTAVYASGVKLAKWGAIAGVAGAAAGVYLVKQQLDAVDALAKTSDKLGIQTHRLVGLTLAAEEAGVSAEALSKALEFSAVNAVKGATGAKTQADAFKRLGLSAAVVAAMQPDQRFEAIAEALSKIRNQSEKLDLAKTIFGKGGVALIPMLSMGKKGLEEAQQAARALGLTITRDMAAAVERANDAFGRLLMLVQGVARQLAVRFAPLIEQASKMLVAFFTQDGAVEKFADTLATTMVNAIGLVIDTIHELRVTFAALRKDVLQTVFDIQTSGAGSLFGISGSAAQTKIAERMADADLRNLQSDAGGRGAGARWAAEQVQAYKSFMQGLEASGRNIASPIGDAIAGWFSTPQAIGLFGGIGRGIAAVSNARPLDRAVKFIAGKSTRQVDQELTARSRGDIDTYSAARRNMRNKAEKAQEQTAKNTAEMRKWLQKIHAAGGGMGRLPIGG